MRAVSDGVEESEGKAARTIAKGGGGCTRSMQGFAPSARI